MRKTGDICWVGVAISYLDYDWSLNGNNDLGISILVSIDWAELW
jgi:hypothetical protein